MRQPRIVVTVEGGIAEVLRNVTDEDVLIIDFGWLEEHGTPEEGEEVERLLDSGNFNEVSEYLANLEEEWLARS